MLLRTAISVLAVAFSFAVGCASSIMLPPVILSVEASEQLTEDFARSITASIQLRTGSVAYACLLPASAEDTSEASWVPADGEVTFEVYEGGDYAVWARDDKGCISDPTYISVELDAVKSLQLNHQAVYMPLEDTAELSAELEVVGQPDETVSYSSSDSSVVTVDQDGTLAAVAPGTAEVTATTAGGASAVCTVTVSDLYNKTTLTGLKPYVPAYRYTQEEAHLLDQALFYEIEEAGGYGTRAAVVAAVRFLTLQFPYRVPYFFENGRLMNQEGRPFCDGEGRYYHLGLYLSTDKYEDIVYSVSGPAIWGVNLTNYEDKYHFVRYQRYPNGLDCSGFVTWAIYNGGFDIGDTGAGDFIDYDYDLCDYGEQVPLTVELLQSGEVKAGDLIGEDGHIALVAGIDLENGYIHVAESLAAGVKISSYTFYRCTTVGLYDFICKMDSYYEQDGNYTAMWEDEGDYFATYYTN